MDRNWMRRSRASQDYIEGVKGFIEFAYSHGASINGLLKCPCPKCCNVLVQSREVTYEHMICNGILQNYTKWYRHGEDILDSLPPQNLSTSNKNNRAQKTLTHTAGTKSLARVRNEQSLVGRAEKFVKTCTQKDDTPINDEATDKIDQMRTPMESSSHTPSNGADVNELNKIWERLQRTEERLDEERRQREALVAQHAREYAELRSLINSLQRQDLGQSFANDTPPDCS